LHIQLQLFVTAIHNKQMYMKQASPTLRVPYQFDNSSWQNCLVLSAAVFKPPTRTRQNCLVLSMSAVWTSY